MKKFHKKGVIVILAAALVAMAGSNFFNPGQAGAEDPGPVVTMATPLVKMAGKKTAGVVIMGTGFKPGQEIRLLFHTSDGLKSDIGYLLKPEPRPDETGSWITTWSAGRYVSRKLVNPKGGAYKIVATDVEYNPIAQSVVSFQAAKKKKKKK